jgi:hypothetical protein
VKYWEIIADNLHKAEWSLGWVSALDLQGRRIWIVDAHRDDGKHFVVHADEKLTTFMELEAAIRPSAWNSAWLASALASLDEHQKSCTGRSEAAFVEVEGAELVREIDVKVLTSRRAGFACSDGHQASADTLPLHARLHDDVQNKGVAPAIPRNVHKSDEFCAIAGRDPAQAV